MTDRTNYAVFGSTDVKEEADLSGGGLFGFGAAAPDPNAKKCKEIVFDDDDEIKFVNVSVKDDKVTKIVFTTEKEQVYELGRDVPEATV